MDAAQEIADIKAEIAELKELLKDGSISEAGERIAIRNQIVENTKLITTLTARLPPLQNAPAGKIHVSFIHKCMVSYIYSYILFIFSLVTIICFL